MPEHRQGVPDPRAAVRVAQFERSLEMFNREQGTKVALVLAKYDEEMVQPRIAALEARVVALETPWWRRVAARWEKRAKERRIRSILALARDIAATAVAPNVHREFDPPPEHPEIGVGVDENGLTLTLNGKLLRPLFFATLTASHGEAQDRIFDWLWNESKSALRQAGAKPFRPAHG